MQLNQISPSEHLGLAWWQRALPRSQLGFRAFVSRAPAPS
jgi:hypothetical protein